MTPTEEAYIAARLKGLPPRAAAMSCGLSEKTAAATGTKFEKKLYDEICRRRAGSEPPSSGNCGVENFSNVSEGDHVKELTGEVITRAESSEYEKSGDHLLDVVIPMIESCDGDPMLFMERMMDHQDIDLRLRFEAAKTLMPFKHQKLGELGKKESKQKKAEDVGKGKFGPGRAPTLKAV